MARSAFEYLESEQSQVVEFLRRNTSVSGFIQGILEHCVNFCNAEGIPFEEIEIDRPYIAHDEFIRARIIKKV